MLITSSFKHICSFSRKLSAKSPLIISKMSISKKCMIAVCQMTSTNDKEKNFETCRTLVSEAKTCNAKVAFFPEACDFIGSSKKESFELSEPLDGPLVGRYKALAKEFGIWLSLGGIHEKATGSEKLSNTHIIINENGDLVQKYHKLHLFDVDIPEQKIKLVESSYVQKGEAIVDPVQTPAGKIGLAICYDMRFAELALTLRNMGADILTYPSAFTFATGASHWEALLRARAIETQCYVVAAAQTGAHNDKRTSWGHAMVVDPWGKVIAQCSDGTGLALASIDLVYLDKVRLNLPVHNHRRTDLYPAMGGQGGGCGAERCKDGFYQFGQAWVLVLPFIFWLLFYSLHTLQKKTISSELAT